MNPESASLLTGLVLILVGLSLGTAALQRWVVKDEPNLVVDTLIARISSWWGMLVMLTLAGIFGRFGLVILFGLVSFAAQREFLTLTAKRRADHWVLMASFFFVLPAQYVLVYFGVFELFTIMIPVYAFLFLPVLAVVRGDTSAFLTRVAETQWGLMLTLFAASHVPALMSLDIPGFEEKELLLIAWLAIVVQGSDAAHFIAPRLAGRTPMSARVPHARTWEGFLGAIGAGVLSGTLLAWITPFAPWQAALIAGAVTLMGYAGGMVMAAIKRDRGVRDWGHLLPGQGGFIDRLGSVFFAAPLFYHLTRYLFAVN